MARCLRNGSSPITIALVQVLRGSCGARRGDIGAHCRSGPAPQGNLEALRQAVVSAPRSRREDFLLRIQMNGTEESPLYWAIQACARTRAQADSQVHIRAFTCKHMSPPPDPCAFTCTCLYENTLQMKLVPCLFVYLALILPLIVSPSSPPTHPPRPSTLGRLPSPLSTFPHHLSLYFFFLVLLATALPSHCPSTYLACLPQSPAQDGHVELARYMIRDLLAIRADRDR